MTAADDESATKSGDLLTFSLGAGAPDWLWIDPATGLLESIDPATSNQTTPTAEARMPPTDAVGDYPITI